MVEDFKHQITFIRIIKMTNFTIVMQVVTQTQIAIIKLYLKVYSSLLNQFKKQELLVPRKTKWPRRDQCRELKEFEVIIHSPKYYIFNYIDILYK